ncbi:Hypothetical predicted protein [Podarcis lilfordi]|uniref:Uncharacterized protein n=1 Tax=Podarcis lilfordi TaxID=74358 RepID=A0AA35PBI3_9SAUR|nr:Hypothetical predicted protein [Podarcis lilfordi]
MPTDLPRRIWSSPKLRLKRCSPHQGTVRQTGYQVQTTTPPLLKAQRAPQNQVEVEKPPDTRACQTPECPFEEQGLLRGKGIFMSKLTKASQVVCSCSQGPCSRALREASWLALPRKNYDRRRAHWKILSLSPCTLLIARCKKKRIMGESVFTITCPVV